MKKVRWASRLGIVVGLSTLILVGCPARSRLDNDAILKRVEALEMQLLQTRLELESVNATLKAVAEDGWLSNTFTSASLAFRVPVDLLKAISYVESRWRRFDSSPSVDSKYGLMGLSRDKTLPLAAEHLNLTSELIRASPIENIRGGAAVLRHLYRQLFEEAHPPEDPMQWYEILEEYSSLTEDSLRRMYADEVMKVLERGVTETVLGETITIRPHTNE